MKRWSTVQDFIASGKAPASETVAAFEGFASKGDGGASFWVKTGSTGVPSQSPTDLNAAVLTDSQGVYWRPTSGAIFYFDGTNQWFPAPFGNEGAGLYQFDGVGWNYYEQAGGAVSIAVTTGLITNEFNYDVGTALTFAGYSAPGDGGGAQWVKTATIGTPSQTPAIRGDGTLTDALGYVWKLSDNDEVTPESVGAKGDGVTDDTAALQTAISKASSAGVVLICSREYATFSTILFNASGLTVEFIGNAVIKPDSSVLEAVHIGGTNLPTRMKLKGLRVDRVAYNGATENVGFKYFECNQSTFEDFESRFSKYNHQFAPSAAGMAYNVLTNMQAVGGFYNFHGAPTGTGFFNENVFIGGRGFVTGDTDTNLYLEEGGADLNHNRFLSMSLEGAARSIYCNAGSNYFEFPRTEGSTTDVEFGPQSEYNFVLSTRFDLEVTDNGSRNSYVTYGSGTKLVTGQNNKTTLDVVREGANTSGIPATTIKDEYSISGDSYLAEWRHGRESANSFVYKSIRDSDDLVRASLTTNGKHYVAQQSAVGQSSWNFSPLMLGNYVLWVDSSGSLRIKDGAPTSETDGVIVGTQS